MLFYADLHCLCHILVCSNGQLLIVGFVKIKHFTKKLPRRLICVVLHVNILLRHFTHTTYFNEVFVWVKRCGFINVLCARVIRLNQSLFGY